jgi:hypothetical protein
MYRRMKTEERRKEIGDRRPGTLTTDDADGTDTGRSPGQSPASYQPRAKLCIIPAQGNALGS